MVYKQPVGHIGQQLSGTTTASVHCKVGQLFVKQLTVPENTNFKNIPLFHKITSKVQIMQEKELLEELQTHTTLNGRIFPFKPLQLDNNYYIHNITIHKQTRATPSSHCTP